MINFRYHVVSILAVFLALAIGTVMGASFVGRGLIDNLQGRIDERGAARPTRRTPRMSDSSARTTNSNKYVDETQLFAVARSLVGVRANVVAERGTDGGTVDAQVALLREGGGTVPGVVWLEEKWSLSEPGSAGELRAATGLTNRSKPALRDAAARLLGQRLAATTAPTADDVLAKLADAKFVTLEGAAGSPTPTAADFVGAVARECSKSAGRVTRCRAISCPRWPRVRSTRARRWRWRKRSSPSDQGPDRTAWIDAIANADGLRGRISTIDDVELVEGRVARHVGAVRARAGNGRELRPRPRPSGTGEDPDRPVGQESPNRTARSGPPRSEYARRADWTGGCRSRMDRRVSRRPIPACAPARNCGARRRWPARTFAAPRCSPRPGWCSSWRCSSWRPAAPGSARSGSVTRRG